MRTGIEIDNLDEQQLFEIAMVVFNINEQADKHPNKITLEADYRNGKNPYWVALLPYLDRIDGMTEDEIPGDQALLYWVEEDVLLRLSEAGLLTYKTKFKTVDDIFETGRSGELPVSYTIELKDKYDEYSKSLIRAAKSKLTVPATLSFARFSNPLVSVQNKELPLKPMRNGTAFDIVVNCLEKHPNEAVTLKSLKESLALTGVTNINEALRKSHFDSTSGLLRSFVESSPQFIKVKPSIDLPLSQLEDIETASNNL
jgi:hypothetical protein